MSDLPELTKLYTRPVPYLVPLAKPYFEHGSQTCRWPPSVLERFESAWNALEFRGVFRLLSPRMMVHLHAAYSDGMVSNGTYECVLMYVVPDASSGKEHPGAPRELMFHHSISWLELHSARFDIVTKTYRMMLRKVWDHELSEGVRWADGRPGGPLGDPDDLHPPALKDPEHMRFTP